MPSGGAMPLEKIHVFHPDANLENLIDIRIRYDCDPAHWICGIIGKDELSLTELEIVDEMCQHIKKKFVPSLAIKQGVEITLII